MIERILKTATHLSNVLNPNAPIVHLEQSTKNKTAGIALFILFSLLTFGVMTVIYIRLAYNKQITLKKLTLARAQIKLLSEPGLIENSLINKIKNIFDKSSFTTSRLGELHEIHALITEITNKVKYDSNLKKIMKNFLYNLDKIKIFALNRKLVAIDLTAQKFLLKNPDYKPGKIVIEKIESTSMRLSQDLEEITQILNESFPENYQSLKLPQFLFQKDKDFIVARDEASKEILGITGIKTRQDNSIEIIRVSRKANASKRGIGELLFKHLQTHYFPYHKAILDVHKDNLSAMRIYARYGFKQIGFTSWTKNWVVMQRAQGQIF